MLQFPFRVEERRRRVLTAGGRQGVRLVEKLLESSIGGIPLREMKPRLRFLDHTDGCRVAGHFDGAVRGPGSGRLHGVGVSVETCKDVSRGRVEVGLPHAAEEPEGKGQLLPTPWMKRLFTGGGVQERGRFHGGSALQFKLSETAQPRGIVLETRSPFSRRRRNVRFHDPRFRFPRCKCDNGVRFNRNTYGVIQEDIQMLPGFV